MLLWCGLIHLSVPKVCTYANNPKSPNNLLVVWFDGAFTDEIISPNSRDIYTLMTIIALIALITLLCGLVVVQDV